MLAAAFMAAAPARAQAPAPAEAAEGALPPDEARLLADLLKDDDKRAALIAQLERAGGGAPAGEEGAKAAELSTGARIAEWSAGAAQDLADGFAALRDLAVAAPAAFSRLSLEEIDQLFGALRDLALVIAVTVVALALLRFWLGRVYRRLGARAHDGGAARVLAVLAAMAAMDAAAVLAAMAAGYVAALAFAGASGGVGVRQALYLNAFAVVGLINVAIRAVLSPSTPTLRLVAIPDRGARAMAIWFGVVAGVLGYGQLLLAPIAARLISAQAGAGVSTILALLAILIVAGLTLYGRRPVAAWLSGGRERRGAAALLIANWHIPALLYLVGLFLVVAARPDGVFWPVLIRSAEVLGAVVVGVVASGAITRAIAHGVRLPESVRARLPLLERRLNGFVPRALWLIRLLIAIAVVGFAVDALGLFDIRGWLETGSGGAILNMFFSVAVIAVIAFALWVALASWVDFRLNPEFGRKATAREMTLLSLLRNAATVVIMVLTLMFALSEIGVNIAPLIASAGVFGLAIGFGAQKLVQDIITGVFIQFENAMNVGDVVTLNGTTGVVEKLTIRSVSLRAVDGCFHIIPFSSVDMVSNYMREYGYFVCDMGIAYRENVSEAKQAMHDAFTELMENPALEPAILGGLEWSGLQELADSKVVLRARIKCAPGMQWAVGRGYNEVAKRIFDERGIEIAFPHQTIYFGVDKNGDAPPVHVVSRAPLEPPAGKAGGDGADSASTAKEG